MYEPHVQYKFKLLLSIILTMRLNTKEKVSISKTPVNKKKGKIRFRYMTYMDKVIN